MNNNNAVELAHPAYELPFFADYQEAGGALTGRLQDASEGLEKRTDSEGNVWAFNELMGEWQLVWVLQLGETIWNLLPVWYGTQSLDLVHMVRDVPQNRPILGPDAAQAFPGDVILVPDLASPFEGLPAPVIPEIPTAVIPPELTSFIPPELVAALPVGAVLPGVPGITSPGQPTAAPMPATVEAPTNGALPAVNVYLEGVPIPQPVAFTPTVPEVRNGARPTNGARESWWTPGRTAAVAIGGAAAVGLIAVLVARGRRRR